MQIGSLPQDLAMCCDEEIVHALTELRQYWSSLMKHDRAKMLRIDVYTVKTLQLLAPGDSSKDRSTVKGPVYSGEVFSSFTASERSSIWKQMKKKEGIIPSLYTFFKNLWYLESCANCMKRLITPTKSFPTIKSAMRAAFLSFDPANAQFLIQTSEIGFRRYSRSQADAAELGYRQLWLYAMRHYPRLSKKPQKKDPAAKLIRDVVDHMILYDMAVLARRLGFESPQIDQLIQQSPDRQIAQDALLRARRPDRYRYNEGEVESLIDKVTECFLKAIPLDHQPPGQCVGGRETKKESRYGHPQAKDQLQDRQFLFFDQIHDDSVPTAQKATSLFVRRSVYLTFFSKLPIPDVNNDTADQSPNPDLPMSPLFVPSDLSTQDRRGGEQGGFADTRSHRDGSLERQRLKDARRARRRQKRDKKLRRRQQQERQSSRAESHSRSYSGNLSISLPASDMEIVRIDSMESREIEEGLEPTIETEAGSISGSSGIKGRGELSQEGTEESIPRRESVADANMEEHASEQGGDAAERAEQVSPVGEVENTLNTLEGRGSITAEVQGPSRTASRKSAALREGAKWNPYDRTPRRRQQTPGLSVPPPQETLEQEISTLLQPTQTAVQEQTTRSLTQINFLEAQRRPQSGTNEEQSPWPGTEERDENFDRTMSLSASLSATAPSQMPETPAPNPAVLASQDGLTQNHHGRPEEALGYSEAEIEPQSEIPSLIDRKSRRHGIMNPQLEPHGRSPDPVPAVGLPQVHGMAGAAQQQIVTQSDTLLSPQAKVMAPGASTQPDAHIRADAGRTEELPEEQDGSGGQVKCRRRRGEGAGKKPRAATELPGMRITFRGRDENGEWNRVVHQMVVDPSDPSPVARMAAKNARERKATFYDQNLRTVAPAQCFEAAVEDGTNTVFMTFGDDLVINEDTMDSITRALQSDSDHDRPAKRWQ